MTEVALSLHVETRLAGLREDRLSWWDHWRELATYILPRRYRGLVTPNETRRGSALNQAILDSTGTTAARVLSAGMMSGITSPTRPWFHMGIEGYDIEDTTPVTLWLSEVERRMMRVFQESNFYNSFAVLWGDLVVFGTAVDLIYEDYEDVIRCYNVVAGEYYLANSDRNAVDTIYREFTLTATQIIQWFGEENCSPDIQSAWRTGGSSLSREFTIAHAIEPNTKFFEGLEVPKTFPFREVYWEFGRANGGKFLAQRGFHEFPGLCPRWDVTSNEAYGRSPGMDALPDIKQLQQETKRKAQAIDKMVTPPVVADVQLKNQPTSMLPGGITYVSGVNSVGVKPIFQVQPPIQELKEDIHEIQARIQNIFFNPLFLTISQLDVVPTATEILARREEQLVMLGPVLERSGNEALAPAVERTFNIMSRLGLLPPPPEEIAGRYIKVDFVSMLAAAQSAVSTGAIERVFGLAGSVVGVAPDIMDNIDVDEAIQDYARRLRLNPKLIRADEVIVAMRDARHKAEQDAAALAATPGLASAGKTLSETDLGGQSALQAMLGGGQ